MKALLFKYQNKKQLIFACIGTFLGLLFLFTSLHFLDKIYRYGDHSEMLSENTIVIQKQVNGGLILNRAKPVFLNSEIEDIRNKSFIQSCDIISSNTFDVLLQINDPLIPKFSSDIYVQSVKKEYLDIETKGWEWNKGQSVLPIIMPRDFLVMMNNFLSASGMPQLSDDLVKDLKIKLKIGGRQSGEMISARIVGFTNELSSILVPEAFLLWANQKFGNQEKKMISQLVVKSNEGQFGLLENYLKENKLESKKSQLLIARLKSTLGILLSVISGISFLTVFLAVLVLVQYLQLILAKNDYEIKTLIRLGHSPHVIIRVFISYFSTVFVLVSGIAFLCFIFSKNYLDQMFLSNGISLDNHYSIYLFWVSIMILLVFIFSIWTSSKNRIEKAVHS